MTKDFSSYWRLTLALLPAMLMLGCPGVVDEDGDGYIAENDCDDTDPSVHPNAEELCDGVDNDCDGSFGEDEKDADSDGVMVCDGDCDDTVEAVHPGADEGCDGLDTDCDGAPGTLEVDEDGDGYMLCEEDCNDNDDAVHPGADEVPGNGLDDDCNEATSDDVVDQDGDGYTVDEGDCDDTDATLNPADADADGESTCDGDCDDDDPARYPSAEESCDGIDNNCDEIIPEDEIDDDTDGASECEGDCDDTDATANITDGDTDGVDTCGIDGIPDTGDEDCNDSNATVYPGASELCDGLDTDCDGTVPADETDDDGDTMSECAGDCDDTDPDVYDGAPEICDGVTDNDCDGGDDPDELDGDGDGYSSCDGDCDDGEAVQFPGNGEVCDGLDNDCDGALPSDETDGDGDGQSTCEGDCDDTDAALNQLDGDSDGYGTCSGDCDDGDAQRSPGLTEVSCDGVDNDCDAATDDEADADGDGVTVCDGDCDDGDAGVFPGQEEVPCNGVDDDCDGVEPDELWVPTPYPTVQEGIDAAGVGDAVCVEPGTYSENIDFGGAEIHVLGVEGPETTIIDGGNSAAVVTFSSGESRDAILEGFTLQDVVHTGAGGGVYVEASSPTLRNLIIQECSVYSGGGLYVLGPSAEPLVQNTEFRDNISRGGAGIYVVQADIEVENCVFLDNASIAEEGGGGIGLYYSTATVSNSLFTSNEGCGGGGIYVGVNSSCTVTHSNFIANSGGTMGSCDGGAFYVYSSGSLSLSSCILEDNRSINGGGIATAAGASVDVTYTNVWNNTPQDYYGMADPTWSFGNTSYQPAFLDTFDPDPRLWDMHLAMGSQMIDAGDAGLFDPDGSRSDMGMYGGPGAGGWDRDGDGYPEWWQPGAYDHGLYPADGWDCDDQDRAVYPGNGC